jgi:hypothetical protein
MQGCSIARGIKRLTDWGECWKIPQELAQQEDQASLKLLERDMGEEVLPKPMTRVLEQPREESPPPFPSLQVTTETGDWQEGLENILTFNTLESLRKWGLRHCTYQRCHATNTSIPKPVAIRTAHVGLPLPFIRRSDSLSQQKHIGQPDWIAVFRWNMRGLRQNSWTIVRNGMRQQ